MTQTTNAALLTRVDALEKSLKREAAERKRLEKALADSLAQQTATADILRVISSSPRDLQPVFDTIVRSAVRLCDGLFSGLHRFDGELIHQVAQYNYSPEALDAARRVLPTPPSRDFAVTRAILDRAIVHIPDVELDPEYRQVISRAAGVRSILAVPMLRDGSVSGAIAVGRAQPGPFSDKQLELLKTFADQAVIAIENVRLFTELEEKTRALTQAHAQVTEALEQQTATSEILKVISQSQTDVQPVFEAIAKAALRLCGAKHGSVHLFDGQLIHLASVAGADPESSEAVRRSFPRRPGRTSTTARAIQTRSAVVIPDVLDDAEYQLTGMARVAGFRSTLSVPMLRGGDPIGAINVTRETPGSFSDKLIVLLQTFADQAVIAIENVRLFQELQTRNVELTEALEQQTATSEILQVISSSPTDTQPVFDAIVRSASRLCGSEWAIVTRYDGQLLHLAAQHNPRPGSADETARFFPQVPRRETSITARALVDAAIVHVSDVETEELEPSAHEYYRRIRLRAAVAVPMVHEGRPVGVVSVSRVAPGPFSDRQIHLLRTFADQAVIAIENVRLFQELKARTADLTRSVEQLTALGEVGRAVSSTLDLETVLTTIVSRAVQLSGLDAGVVFEYDENAEEFVQRAMTQTGGALVEARRTTRIRKGEGVLGRTAITLEPVQVPDIAMQGAYEGRLREILIDSGIRAILAVPMVREDRLIGCLGVTRNRPGEFPAETIELLRTFATQSALAIQNARLFHEIEDKSRQLEAASRHKSEFLANMSHELRTPLNAIIGFSEVLTERMFGELNDKQDEYLKDIYASGQHLLSLINDILDLSKIEAGRMELEPADFDLPSAIENALILVRERAGRRGIMLGRTIDERVGAIHADERKVKQVLLNLLSNALKFTPEGGRIDVRAAMNEGEAEISVSDTGIGIAPEDQAAIFEEFRQVGSDETRKQEGTGLGLTLAKKFVELHSGRIWVESELGRGSTFTFTLPVS